MMAWMQTKLAGLPANVGMEGGDLPTRRIALLVVASLTVLAAPPFAVSYSTLKICALLSSMSGALFLMAGLAFLQKTHYAGIVLVPTPLLMIGLCGLGVSWLAVGVGFLAAAVIVQNLVTSRCGINKLLGINSNSCACEAPTTEGQDRSA